MCESQSVGGEGGGGGLQGAGGVGASHVGEEVGVRAQLMDVEAVLLAVRQTSPDKRLGSRAECVIQRAAGCGCVCVCVPAPCAASLFELIQMLRHVSARHGRVNSLFNSQGQ